MWIYFWQNAYDVEYYLHMAKNSDLDFKTTDNLQTNKQENKERHTQDIIESQNEEQVQNQEALNEVIVEDIIVEENATLNANELRKEIEDLKQVIIDTNNRMF